MKTNAKPKIVVKSVVKTSGGGLPFAIERNVPLAARKKPNPYHDLFLAMKISDSFLIGEDKEEIARVTYNAQKWGRENNATFAFRITDDGKRCWRIK